MNQNKFIMTNNIKTDCDDILNIYLSNLSVGLANQYKPKIESFNNSLIKYGIKNNYKKLEMLYKDINFHLLKEFAISYIIENKIKSETCLNDYLKAIIKYYEYIHEHKIINFNFLIDLNKNKDSLFIDIYEKLIKEHAIKLEPPKSAQPILYNQYEFAIDYICTKKIKLYSKIILKLHLYYGFGDKVIKKLKIKYYDIDKNILSVNGYEINLKNDLKIDLCEYLKYRKNINIDDLLIINDKGKTFNNTHASTFLKNINTHYYPEKKGIIQITSLQKFAVCNMILNKINNCLIKKLTKHNENFINDCYKFLFENEFFNEKQIIKDSINKIKNYQ